MKLKNILLALLTSLVISLFIVGCSDDKAEKTSKKTEEVFNPFDHSKDEKISTSEKEQFEKAFAEQCVKRETTSNPNADKDRTAQSCTCVATYLMKDLTAKEAEKFVTEHENPVSLTFKFENAAYHCLQQKVPPKDSGFTPVTPK
jgi:hypothetical protein